MDMKPCPFCGQTAIGRDEFNSAYCKTCGANGPLEQDDTMHMWNTRPFEDWPEETAACGHDNRWYKVEPNDYAWCVLCAIDNLSLSLRDAVKWMEEARKIYPKLILPIWVRR